MVRTGVQVSPTVAGERGGSRCQLSQRGPDKGLRGRGLREDWAGKRGWQGGRWRGRGGQQGSGVGRQVRRVPRRWGWRPGWRGPALARGARGKKGRRTSEEVAFFSEQAEPGRARSAGAAAAERGKADWAPQGYTGDLAAPGAA